MSTDTTSSLNLDISSRGLILTVLDNMIWPILAVMLVGSFIFVPQMFRNVQSAEIILHGSVGLGFLVLAEGLCLLSGHFDLSIGSIAGFSAMFAAMVLSPSEWGLVSDPVLGVLVILAVGTLIGLWNGVMITKMGIDPFLQTLGALIIFRGLMLSLSTQPIYDLPESFYFIGNEAWIAVGILVAVFLLFGYILRFTGFGQSIYAIGSNEESARSIGIDIDRMVIVVYMLSGLLAAVAGLMWAGYSQAVTPSLGNGEVFPAFAAAVIGGISLFGGRGKIVAAFGGVLLLGIIKSALNIAGVGPSQVQAANGIILLVAIILYNSRTKLRAHIIKGSA